MKLLFKQRLFSWFDSYDIYDEAGNTVYVVKGQLSWGHKLVIYDAYGNEVGMVVQKVLTFLPKYSESLFVFTHPVKLITSANVNMIIMLLCFIDSSIFCLVPNY